MMLARFLSKEEFGLWAFFLSVFTMFDMLRSGLLSSATVKFYTDGLPKEELNQIEKSVLQLGVIVSLLSFLFPILYYALGYNYTKPELQVIAIGIVPLSFVSLLPSVATWFAQARQNFKAILKIRLTIQLTFFAAIAAGFFWNLSLVSVFYGYCLSYVLAAVWAVAGGQLKISALFGSLGTWLHRIFKFGSFSMGTLLGSNLLRNSDTYIIMGFLNEASVAMYNVPNRILGMLDIPIQAFSSADYPRFVDLIHRGKHNDLQQGFNKGLGLSILVVWPAALVVFFAAKWLVVLVAGVQYENSYLILRIFAIYAALLPVDRYTGLVLDAAGRPKKNMYKVLLMLVANVVLDIVVLQLGYGLEAVAMVSLVTYSVGITFGFLAIRDLVKLQIFQSVASAITLVLAKFRR